MRSDMDMNMETAAGQFKSVNELIGTIHRAMRHFFECQMKKYNVTPPQFEVLLTLWGEDGLVLSELGKRLSRDGPTITGIIDRMEKKTLVRRKRSMRDRRVIQVFLTVRAEEIRENLMKMQQQAGEHITKNISDDDIIRLETLLSRLLSNIEDSLVSKAS